MKCANFLLFLTLWIQWRTKFDAEATLYICSWNMNFTAFHCVNNLNRRILKISHSLIPQHSVTPVIFQLISSFLLLACCQWTRFLFAFHLASNRSVAFCSLRWPIAMFFFQTHTQLYLLQVYSCFVMYSISTFSPVNISQITFLVITAYHFLSWLPSSKECN